MVVLRLLAAAVTFTHPFTGEHTIEYTDDNEFGCISTVSKTVEVDPNKLAGQVESYNEQEGPGAVSFMTQYAIIRIFLVCFNVLLLTQDVYTDTLMATAMYDGNLENYLNDVQDGTITPFGHELAEK
ncbi:MAG: hypothetical protein U5L09_12665 [Bacteroidales bacterium]|nr:hypothetical protein [Bacteroidales bacterium]